MPRIIDCQIRLGVGEEENATCPICLEPIEQDTETLTHDICRTTYCRECLERWIEEQAFGEYARCPMDRLIIGIGESEDDYDEDDDDDDDDDDDEYDDEDDDGDEHHYGGDGENVAIEVPLAVLDEAFPSSLRDADGDHIIFDPVDTNVPSTSVQSSISHPRQTQHTMNTSSDAASQARTDVVRARLYLRIHDQNVGEESEQLANELRSSIDISHHRSAVSEPIPPGTLANDGTHGIVV